MNERRTSVTVFAWLPLLAIGLLLAGTVLAQGVYSIDWSVMGGGGGHDAAGNTSLDYTIGQPVVGLDVVGSRELSSGFWYGLSCYTLAVAADPAAGGSVQVDPAPDCGAQYLQGTVVTLTAVSNAGYVFEHWSGDASGSENPIHVTMDGDKSVTAHFGQGQSYSIYLPVALKGSSR